MSVLFDCTMCGKKARQAPPWKCKCGGILEVIQDLEALAGEIDDARELFDSRLGSRVPPYSSGVWRFKELIHPTIALSQVITRGEGGTGLYSSTNVSSFAGSNLLLKHDGENPTASFKDRGMTVGISEAVRQGAKTVACASTGNTSSSLAAYAAIAGLHCKVFIPKGKISSGKLFQTIAYGAEVVQLEGNFDDAMRQVQLDAAQNGTYLLNSLNPWRIEGQKTVALEIFQQLEWKTPDWIALPAGNLGNTSAVGKAIVEAKKLGLIDRIPRIASVQATGANPFYSMWKNGSLQPTPVSEPHTIASAIQIGNPVSWKKAIGAIKNTNGVVTQVTDEEIIAAKRVIDSAGIGCEPASAASVAGTRKLVLEGVIDKSETVACILTGNLLKDPVIR